MSERKNTVKAVKGQYIAINHSEEFASRLVAWLRDNDCYPLGSTLVGSPVFTYGFYPDEKADKLLAWLRQEGIEVL